MNHAETRSEAICGVDASKWPLDALIESVHARTSPHLTPRADTFIIDGKTVFALHVPAGGDVYSTTEGVYKIRLGDKCLAVEGQQLRGLRALRQQYDWSAEPNAASWNNLSKAAIERGAQLLRQAGRDELAALATTDIRAFARAARLESTEGGPNNAAVLLYGSPEALRQVPEWGVNVQTRPSPGSDPRVLLRRAATDQPLVLLIDQLINLVSANTTSRLVRIGAVEFELVDYPNDALRELFANAFAHRDWEAAGVVEIVHSPDELTVTSPGGLLPTLRVDRLLHNASASRNHTLTEHMATLWLAEASGLGFDRVFRAVAMQGKEPPRMEDGMRFRVTLAGRAADEAFAKFVRSEKFPRDLSADVDVLTVLTALRRTRSVTAESLSGRLQRSINEANAVLTRMTHADLINPTKSTARRANTNYVLSPASIAGMRTALTYRTTSVDHDDQKLLRHLRRHGKITNEDVRNYLDCDLMTARNRLRRLRDLKLIDFAPDSPRRGPQVEYVATPKGMDTSEPPSDRAPRPPQELRLF